MWVVRLALRRSYTFVERVPMRLLLTPFVVMRIPTGVFPPIHLPVVSAIWTYGGLITDH